MLAVLPSTFLFDRRRDRFKKLARNVLKIVAGPPQATGLHRSTQAPSKYWYARLAFRMMMQVASYFASLMRSETHST